MEKRPREGHQTVYVRGHCGPMLGSNRLLVATIVGLAILNPVSQDACAQKGATDGAQQPKQDSKPIDLSPIEDQLKGITRAIESSQHDPYAEQDRERADRDLDAQDRMAFWARLLFYATVASLFLTAAGLFLIYRTLVHTRRAADFASDMVQEAKLTTKAAQDSIAETKRVGEAQVRAYLTAHDVVVNIDHQDHKVSVAYTVTNNGNSPALNVLVGSRGCPELC